MSEIQNRGQRLTVNVEDVQPNAWNPNRMNDFMLPRLSASMRKFGVVSEILVRETEDGGYEVVDGEHRWRELVDSGAKTLEVRNLGKISRDEAQQLTLVMNELKGTPSAPLMNLVLSDLKADGSLDEALDVLPLSEFEVEQFLNLSRQGDQDDLPLEQTEEVDELEDEWVDAEVEAKENKPTADHVRFVVGNYKGYLPDELASRLRAIWIAIADHASTDTPMVVLPAIMKAAMVGMEKSKKEEE
jgi:hypothetical protein